MFKSTLDKFWNFLVLWASEINEQRSKNNIRGMY